MAKAEMAVALVVDVFVSAAAAVVVVVVVVVVSSSSSSSSSSSALEFCLGKTQNHSLEVSKDLLFCLRMCTEKKRVPFCPFLSRRMGPF